MEYTVLRSKRKTVSLEVRPDLTVLVRAPKLMSKKQIDAFVQRHEVWLNRTLERTARRAEWEKTLDSPEREKELRRKAKEYLPGKTEEWAKIMGVSPTGITVTGAKTRFGSCSPKNRICYSWRLMAYPPEAIEYVIVHELAHILQKNHSPRFYAVVEWYLPDWKARRNLLKTR